MNKDNYMKQAGHIPEDKVTLFSAAMDEAMDGIHILDLDGRIIYANRASEELSGFKPEELAGKHVRDIEADPDLADSVILPVVKARGRWNGETMMRRLSGRDIPVWLSASIVKSSGGEPIAIVCVMRDLTLRKQAEADIIRNADTESTISAILQLSLEAMPMEVILSRVLDRILAVRWLSLEARGGVFLAMEGSSSLEMKASRGLSDAVMKRCSQVPSGTCLCGRAAATGEIQFAATIDERHDICYDGMKPHGHYCVPILLSGKVFGVIVLYLVEGHEQKQSETEFLRSTANALAGVIQRKTMEREREALIAGLKEQEVRLATNERLAALGRMASGIAHEINNPLAAINGCAEGLMSRIEKGHYDPEFFKSYLAIIQEEIFRCKNITTGMLSFVKKESYEKMTVDLHALLEKTIDVLGYQGRLKNMTVIQKLHPDMPLIRGSEGELRQVFLAIITNALDAMQETGTVILSTSLERNCVVISIEDRGPGIAIDLQGKIFDPFFTTKSDKGGTGLGLAIASKIVTNHGGSITVSSVPGNGSAFTIRLPFEETGL